MALGKKQEEPLPRSAKRNLDPGQECSMSTDSFCLMTKIGISNFVTKCVQTCKSTIESCKLGLP